MVEIAAGDQDASNWALPHCAWLEFRRALNLRAQIRRRVEQEPLFAAAADGDLTLRAGACAQFPLSDASTQDTPTVPLRKSPTRGRTQNLDPHTVC